MEKETFIKIRVTFDIQEEDSYLTTFWEQGIYHYEGYDKFFREKEEMDKMVEEISSTAKKLLCQ